MTLERTPFVTFNTSFLSQSPSRWFRVQAVILVWGAASQWPPLEFSQHRSKWLTGLSPNKGSAAWRLAWKVSGKWCRLALFLKDRFVFLWFYVRAAFEPTFLFPPPQDLRDRFWISRTTWAFLGNTCCYYFLTLWGECFQQGSIVTACRHTRVHFTIWKCMFLLLLCCQE